jgi:hypothetical protein
MFTSLSSCELCGWVWSSDVCSYYPLFVGRLAAAPVIMFFT